MPGQQLLDLMGVTTYEELLKTPAVSGGGERGSLDRRGPRRAPFCAFRHVPSTMQAPKPRVEIRSPLNSCL